MRRARRVTVAQQDGELVAAVAEDLVGLAPGLDEGIGDALQRGVLDGVIAPYEALKSLSFAEVIKYYSELPHSRGAYPSRAMNAAAWNNLPEDIQQVFLDNIEWLTDRTYDLAQGAEDAGREHGEALGVTFNAVDPAVIAEYSAAFEPAARETAAQLDAAGLPGTEIHDKIRAALAD